MNTKIIGGRAQFFPTHKCEGFLETQFFGDAILKDQF